MRVAGNGIKDITTYTADETQFESYSRVGLDSGYDADETGHVAKVKW